jgi:hypothetical protein
MELKVKHICGTELQARIITDSDTGEAWVEVETCGICQQRAVDELQDKFLAEDRT